MITNSVFERLPFSKSIYQNEPKREKAINISMLIIIEHRCSDYYHVITDDLTYRGVILLIQSDVVLTWGHEES